MCNSIGRYIAGAKFIHLSKSTKNCLFFFFKDKLFLYVIIHFLTCCFQKNVNGQLKLKSTETLFLASRNPDSVNMEIIPSNNSFSLGTFYGAIKLLSVKYNLRFFMLSSPNFLNVCSKATAGTFSKQFANLI